METYDVYEPGERRIYKYFDGEKIRPADPMVLWRRLMEVRGDLARDMSVAFAPFENKGKAEAYAGVAEKARQIFQVKCLEEGGLTEPELIDLVNHFWRYCEGVKKNSTPSQDPSDATSPTAGSISLTSEES